MTRTVSGGRESVEGKKKILESSHFSVFLRDLGAIVFVSKRKKTTIVLYVFNVCGNCQSRKISGMQREGRVCLLKEKN